MLIFQTPKEHSTTEFSTLNYFLPLHFKKYFLKHSVFCHNNTPNYWKLFSLVSFSSIMKKQKQKTKKQTNAWLGPATQSKRGGVVQAWADAVTCS